MPARVDPADRNNPQPVRAADDLRTGSTGLA